MRECFSTDVLLNDKTRRRREIWIFVCGMLFSHIFPCSHILFVLVGIHQIRIQVQVPRLHLESIIILFLWISHQEDIQGSNALRYSHVFSFISSLYLSPKITCFHVCVLHWIPQTHYFSSLVMVLSQFYFLS